VRSVEREMRRRNRDAVSEGSRAGRDDRAHERSEVTARGRVGRTTAELARPQFMKCGLGNARMLRRREKRGIPAHKSTVDLCGGIWEMGWESEERRE